MSRKRFDYTLDFKKINFRKRPNLYRVGVGEQGVLLVEPYKSEILPHWKFKTPSEALRSAKKIYSLFLRYIRTDDFPGADMARKFLQMGYTRARRYANHPSGKKYQVVNGKKVVAPQASDWNTNQKSESARIFYGFYVKAREHRVYKKLKSAHVAQYENE